MAQLSQYFKRSEFACKCGCGFDTVDSILLETLEAVRLHFKVPVTITSGCRCLAHNAAVGGAKASQHTLGRASDIQLKGIPPSEVADYVESIGVSVGRYPNFTHLDSRSGQPKRWGQN